MALFRLKRKDDVGMSGVVPQPSGPVLPYKGYDSWAGAGTDRGAARGQPVPQLPNQMRPNGYTQAPMFGGVIQVQTRPYDRGAAAYVPQFGRVLSNPIGAGIVANNRTKPFYGPAGQYIAHTIFWAQQTIPTSVQLSPLVGQDVINALLSQVNVQAALNVG